MQIPDDLNRLVLYRRCVKETAIERRRGDYLAVCQQLRRLGTSAPPDHILFDLIKFGKGPVLTFLGGQNGVHIGRSHAINHQGPFHIFLRDALQADLVTVHR